jgi:hypothetical protein
MHISISRLRLYLSQSRRSFVMASCAIAILGGFIGLAWQMKAPRPEAKHSDHTSSLTPKSVTPSAPNRSTPVVVPTFTTLFSESFNGQDRIFTNAASFYSKSCPYVSPNWEMTSGTVLIRNGIGYSGIPTSETTSTCNSQSATNSAVFRLNTIRQDFSNVRVGLDYDIVKHGGANAPQNPFDGVHIWLGYQDEYDLYAATIFRWDRTFVTKKKVATSKVNCKATSNGGCYSNISPEIKSSTVMTTNTWHHAEIVYSSNPSNLIVTIQTFIDGQLIDTGIDNHVTSSSFPVGALGIRGDDTEFYFKNFIVTKA